MLQQTGQLFYVYFSQFHALITGPLLVRF